MGIVGKGASVLHLTNTEYLQFARKVKQGNKTKKKVIFELDSRAHGQRGDFPEFKISEVEEL